MEFCPPAQGKIEYLGSPWAEVSVNQFYLAPVRQFQGLQLRLHLPHAPGARMTVVNKVPQRKKLVIFILHNMFDCRVSRKLIFLIKRSFSILSHTRFVLKEHRVLPGQWDNMSGNRRTRSFFVRRYFSVQWSLQAEIYEHFKNNQESAIQ